MRKGISRRRIGACLAIAALAGCAVSPDKTPLPTDTQQLNTDQASLITEGEPVFLTGTVSLPGYATGSLGQLTIQAERLAGGPLLGSSPAPVGPDGSFKLEVPQTSKLFFATAAFSTQNGSQELRALARAQFGTSIVLDTASSLMGAKIAVAAQSRSLEALDYTETTELTSQVRAVLGPDLKNLSLDQPDAALSDKLTQLAQKNDTLASRLQSWENTFAPPSPSPSPSASPSPLPSPQESAPPVK